MEYKPYSPCESHIKWLSLLCPNEITVGVTTKNLKRNGISYNCNCSICSIYFKWSKSLISNIQNSARFSVVYFDDWLTLIYKFMTEINLCGVGDSELVKRVHRFVWRNQYSLPVSIRTDNRILVIMVLEDGDFRFSQFYYIWTSLYYFFYCHVLNQR